MALACHRLDNKQSDGHVNEALHRPGIDGEDRSPRKEMTLQKDVDLGEGKAVHIGESHACSSIMLESSIIGITNLRTECNPALGRIPS